MSTITIHHAWSEILRPKPEADATFLVPWYGVAPDEDAIRGILRHLVPMVTHPSIILHDSIVGADHCAGHLRAVFAVERRRASRLLIRQRYPRGVALVAPRRFRSEWPYLPSVAAVLLVWGLSAGDRMHLRVVRREVGPDWLAINATMPFGLASWPEHWPHSGDPYSPSLAHDPTLWRVLYPELVPTARGHTFQHRELLYAVIDEPGDPLHWDALGDAVEEQGLDPSRERLAARLLRDMILPGGAQVAPGLVHQGGAD